MTIASKKPAKGGRLNWIKYIIWVPWLSSILILLFSAGGIRIDFLYQTTYGISIANVYAYIIYYFVILIVVVLSFTAGKRAFCHYVCWMAPFMIIGTKVKNLLKIPSLHLKAEPEKCISCKQCTKVCAMSLDVNEMVKKGCMTNNECILCGECVDVCPNAAIKYSISNK
jgi:polyferredoxin